MVGSITIHPTAVVDTSAQLGEGVLVGPYAIVEAGAVIGVDCQINSHAIVAGGVRMGCGNRVYHHAIVGTDSQDMKYRGEKADLIIGDNNVFREFVTVNRATGSGKATVIGNNCLFLAYSHVAHNCQVGSNVILANCAELGGEVVVEDFAVLGGLVGVHQFCRIGAHAMVGACSKITQDIPPYVTADGHPARPHGLNLVGLKRRGFTRETLTKLKEAYRLIYRSSLLLDEALSRVEAQMGDCPEVAHVVAFTRASKRSLSRPRRQIEDDIVD
ncbi:TPA: acyl-[acyl-carrier-protein]--UDP-N-acetylglucosamine O-acyltransferase [Candidatus Sumerlaeota bacterium]|jgi:UDP-N-acetylglucosamine acyltransferase|nr:acyl-[acyl-carrier-protein]--UDP-N-acetylglucosamine O-acyltransferase [Candidatus Sumerlaeota bacterium]